jgi:hypothetical protein
VKHLLNGHCHQTCDGEKKKKLNGKIFSMLKAYQKHKDMKHNQDNEEIEGDVDV